MSKLLTKDKLDRIEMALVRLESTKAKRCRQPNEMWTGGKQLKKSTEAPRKEPGAESKLRKRPDRGSNGGQFSKFMTELKTKIKEKLN